MPYHSYALSRGYIDTWLVAGPTALTVPDLERYQGADDKAQIVRALTEDGPGLDGAPSDWGEVALRDGLAEQAGRWAYYRCADDHFVDASAFYHLTSYLRCWAYAEVVLPEARRARLALTANGPADVWVNGARAHRTERFQHQIPLTSEAEVELAEGPNRILVRFEAVAARECPFAMALQLRGVGGEPLPDLPVRLPTESQHAEFRAKVERLFAAAYLERDVYAHRDEIAVCWPESVAPEDRQTIAVRLQDRAGRIYFEGLPAAGPGARQVVGRAINFSEGAYVVTLMPHPDAYYLNNVRITRTIPLAIQRNAYSAGPYGDDESRRLEALEDAARRPRDIYAEVAKMELGRWGDLSPAVAEEALAGIEERRDCSDFYLVGLLGALARYGERPGFPQALRERIAAVALGFRYWADDPGADAMWFWSENHQILFHACEVLAGQLFPDATFSNTGMPGAWHRERGERFARAWIDRRATGGFREWDSNCYFEHDVLALSHLADLADDDSLAALAAVAIDKLLFTMALNSFRGVFGSTHGRTYTDHVKGARRELTSGLGRMLWGAGTFNQHTLGTVALACARSYELPSVIAEIATADVDELWSRERHRQELTWAYDRADGVLEVNKVTLRTRDFMLCSAQDHLPGEAGVQQHVWQATLSQDAVVFVTHPPCVSEESSHRPGYWHGNVVLPRVAQWYDTLVDVRRIPAGDWMGFTHAFFPTTAFDEHALRGGWAFARVGEGYLAITAACGVELATRGDSAFRELRSYGLENVWVCHMGRASRDGDFASFQDRVLALGAEIGPGGARVGTLRGQVVEFGWEGPLLVDGREQPLSGFKHYDSPLCACELGERVMEIAGWREVLRLDFGQ